MYMEKENCIKEKVEFDRNLCMQSEYKKKLWNYIVLRKVTSIEGLKIDFLC